MSNPSQSRLTVCLPRAGRCLSGMGWALLLSLHTAHAQPNNLATLTEASAENSAVSAHGRGLTAHNPGTWTRWGGRVGASVDQAFTPWRDNFNLTLPSEGGLNVRSLHVLSDYYIDGGFRATAGVLRGEIGSGWWGSSSTSGPGLSVQRIANAGLLPTTSNGQGMLPSLSQTIPYLGAGYSSQLHFSGAPSAWRLNADLGLASYGAGNANHLSQVMQGDSHLDDLVHELRLRPIVKVSVGYSF